MDNSLIFYTYTHATPDGVVFYVGKGKGRRVYSMADRSWEWHEEMKRHDGIIMRIVARFSTEAEAFTHERLLIDKYRADGVSLVNKTDGGAGPCGYEFTAERKSHLSKKLTGFKHKEVTCPVCGKVGGETTMKRWHFDKCTGNRPFKSRATVGGSRVFLGYYETREMAAKVAEDYKAICLGTYEAPIPNNSVWTIV